MRHRDTDQESLSFFINVKTPQLLRGNTSTPCGAHKGDEKNSLFEPCSVISYGSQLRSSIY